MSKLKIVVALLACCTLPGFAQNSGGAQSQAAPASSETEHVPAGVMLGMVDHKTLPQYPKNALAQGVQGDVVFKIVVDETGKIIHSEAVSGNSVLVAASADALRDYHFRPYLVDGTPRKVDSEVGFHFTLNRNGDSTAGRVECMTTIP